MMTEMDIFGGGNSTLNATEMQYVAANAASVTFSNLNGTPKRVILVGQRADGAYFIYTNFNPTTGEASDTTEHVTYRTSSGTPVAWFSATTEISISGNSVTKTTGNAEAYYWTLLYEY